MNHEKINSVVQIATLVALVAGFILVTWELQQNKDLAYGQILTEELTRFHDRHLTIMSEDPREALIKASLRPDELTEKDLVTLHAYYSTMTLNWTSILLTQRIGGLDRLPWEVTVANQTRMYFSSPIGRRWLEHWAKTNRFADPGVVRAALDTLSKTTEDDFASYLNAMQKDE